MGLPNPTAILRTLPGGMRATVSRGGVVASYAVRSAVRETGALSLAGLDPHGVTNVWTLAADFSPGIRVGDVLTVDSYPASVAIPAFVADAMTTTGNLVARSTVVLCRDTVNIDGQDCACHLLALSQEITADFGGFRPDDMQGFYIPAAILPNPENMIGTSTPIVIEGREFTVARVSLSPKYGVLCVTCSRKGAPANG